MGGGSFAEEGAEAAGGLPAGAGAGVVADAGEVPHVVHGPDDGLAEAQELAHAFEREHALVDPVEADYVGFAHERMAVQGEAVGGGVNLEEVGAVQTVGEEYFQPLGEEWALYGGGGGGEVDERGVVALFGDEHAGIDAEVAQGIHEAAADYGCASGGVGFVYDDDFHMIFLFSGFRPHTAAERS